MALRIAATKSLRASTTASVSRRAFSSLDRMQTKENYEAVLQKFAEIRACAVLRTPTSEACPKAMQAAIDGGFKICEFTLTTPDCLDHLADFRQKYDGDVMVGCGTILNTEDAEKAIDAGSEFIITPVMLPDVIEWCAARNIVCVPGCQTPTELVNAYRHGAPLQKLFPGVAGTLLLKKVCESFCNQGQLLSCSLPKQESPDTLGEERNMSLGLLKRWRFAKYLAFRYLSAAMLKDGDIPSRRP